MSKVRLFILCGLPFSGKTTLAKEVENRYGISRIDLDEINSSHGRGVDGRAISPDEWKMTYELSYQKTRSLLESGHNVLYDSANFTRDQRDSLRNIAGSAGAAAIVIFVDVGETESRSRWQHNRNTRVRYDVRDEDFEQVAQYFEPPKDDENPIVFGSTDSVDDWLDDHSNIFEKE